MICLRSNTCLAGALLATILIAGCASSPAPNVDPIFQAVPGGRYECYHPDDNRNALVKGATSSAGQLVLGGVAGGLLGNQFGSGTGRDIATGAGVAAGAAGGAWNAKRMQANRVRACQRRNGGY